jgi:cytochrome P450
MDELADRDYFTDHSVLRDPYEYFNAVRARAPVYRVPSNGAIYITGFDEALSVLRNSDDWSSVIANQGPAVPLPFEPKGSDITAEIEAHRMSFLGGDLVVGLDDKPHSYSRSILASLFTPSRLRANELFINSFAEEMAAAAVARGRCELMNGIATPFVTMVIADLLGVPDDDRQKFMDVIEAAPPPGSLDTDHLAQQNMPLAVMGRYFINYVEDRRKSPRNDVLSHLSNARYPDGTQPEAMEIVRLATFLFGAGQDTSAKLLGNAMLYIIEIPGLQDRLRADLSLLPDLIEEVLRLEGSSKMTSRVARKDTHIGNTPVPAGTRVMIALSAGNRDPTRWDDPDVLKLDRPRIREHLSFGRGAHVCIGAPLARVEVRIMLEKLLSLTSHIDIDEDVHGPRGNRRLDYDPSFIVRGLSAFHLKLKAA